MIENSLKDDADIELFVKRKDYYDSGDDEE